MKQKGLFLIVLVIMSVLLAACQPAAGGTGVPAYNRTISATGQGQVYLAPDVAYIFIGVHSQAKSVTEALQDNNSKAQQVAQALTEMGVDPKDIQTSSFNVFPQQQFGPNGENTGEVIYIVDNSVNVTIRDLTKLGSMLDSVVTRGANSINGIQFDVENKDEALAQARKTAIEKAKQQAKEIADAAGVQLGDIVNVGVATGGAPVPMYDGKGIGAAAAVPISAGQMSITVDATVTYELK